MGDLARKRTLSASDMKAAAQLLEPRGISRLLQYLSLSRRGTLPANIPCSLVAGLLSGIMDWKKAQSSMRLAQRDPVELLERKTLRKGLFDIRIARESEFSSQEETKAGEVEPKRTQK